MFAYAGNNPVSNVDPTGLDSININWPSFSYENFLNSTTSNIPNINTMLPAAIGIGIGAWEAAGLALNTAGAIYLDSKFSRVESPRSQNVTVYRGTDRAAESMVWNQTGLMMSDATRGAYFATGDLKSSLKAGIQQHVNLAVQYGSEINLAQAQSTMGTEFPYTRSMFSVSTSLRVASNFAGTYGSVYSAVIDRRLLLPSPLNKTSGGEAEYFIRVAYPMMKVR